MSDDASRTDATTNTDRNPALLFARARQEVHALCLGTRKWTMCVPARTDTDSDFVICDALDAGSVLLARVSELERERDHADALLDDWRITNEREVRQFNAGYAACAAFAGTLPLATYDQEPTHERPDGMFEPNEDSWRIGWAWAGYEKLAKERDAMRVLLMLAYDATEIGTGASDELRRAILEAVCPTAPITEADIAWALASFRAAKGETT